VDKNVYRLFGSSELAFCPVSPSRKSCTMVHSRSLPYHSGLEPEVDKQVGQNSAYKKAVSCYLQSLRLRTSNPRMSTKPPYQNTMTKRSPAIPTEVQRLTNEIAILKAQLAAKSSHDQRCPHCKQKIISPAPDPLKQHNSSDPPEDFVFIVAQLPRGEPNRCNVPPKRPQLKA
jgi:hypothetical protein